MKVAFAAMVLALAVAGPAHALTDDEKTVFAVWVQQTSMEGLIAFVEATPEQQSRTLREFAAIRVADAAKREVEAEAAAEEARRQRAALEAVKPRATGR